MTGAVSAPGFFANPAVQVAVAVGGVVALVSGVVGVFTVLRGQSFAGHAMSDLDATGGSGAYLVGVNPLWGFVVIGMAAAGLMEALGNRRPNARDLATGIVLGGGMGLAALFLYLQTTTSSTTGATMTILFGSMFALDTSTIPLVVVLGVLAVGTVAVLYRMLLLSALDPDMARARGVPVRLVGVAYLVAVALSVALSALSIGAILSTALLVGPAASALRLAKRPSWAMAWAAGIGVGAVWLGIVLAYASYDWPPAGRGWPVSFFVVAVIFLTHLATYSRPVERARARLESR